MQSTTTTQGSGPIYSCVNYDSSVAHPQFPLYVCMGSFLVFWLVFFLVLRWRAEDNCAKWIHEMDDEDFEVGT